MRVDDSLPQPPAVIDSPKNPPRNTVPWLSTLAQVVSGMFYCVVSNQRQPNLYSLGEGGWGWGGVLDIVHGLVRITIRPWGWSFGCGAVVLGLFVGVDVGAVHVCCMQVYAPVVVCTCLLVRVLLVFVLLFTYPPPLLSSQPHTPSRWSTKPLPRNRRS